MKVKIIALAVACVGFLTYLQRDSFNSGYDAGWDAGYAELEQEREYAYEDGSKDGYNTGYDEGYNSGYTEGYQEGYGENEDELNFWRECAVIVTTTGRKYHTYDCYHIDGRRYWIYNIELAISKGYTACLDCIEW